MAKKEEIKALAKALKQLNLARTLAEANKRAKELFESGSGRAMTRVLKELTSQANEIRKEANSLQRLVDAVRGDLDEDATFERRSVEREIKSAKNAKSAARAVKSKLELDTRVHRLQKGDVLVSKLEVRKLKSAAENAKYIVDKAEFIQKKNKKKKPKKR